MIKRSTVFIPVVTPKNAQQSNDAPSNFTEGRFIEVYAEAYRFGEDISDLPAEEVAMRQEQSIYDNKAIDKCWDRVSAPLRKNSPSLYQSGSVAANALRKIPFKYRLFAFFQYIKPNAIVESKRLHSVTAWGPTEGRSAELGLALALAASISGKGARVIIATGALSSSKNISNSSSIFRSDDVKVQPVGSLLEKLNLLLFEIQEGAFQELITNQELLVITPKTFMHAGHQQEVRMLAEVKTLNSLGVKVVSVDWLSEALSAIKADTPHYLLIDRVIQIMIGLIIFLVITIGSWLIWRNAEIPMAFISLNPENIEAEPFELCIMDQRQYALPITKTLMVPNMPVSGVIAWKTLIGSSSSVDSRFVKLFGFAGYYIAIVVVSEFSPTTFDYARIGNTTKPLRIMPGQPYEGWVKLNDGAETNALILLTQRHAQFDANGLREQFQKHFPLSMVSSTGNKRQDVDAIIDFIKTLAPGSLIFPFVSVQEDSKCIY